ncbi:MAG: FHA domain-containing protein [Acidobacteria bacterium]|nr:FHA domain-containing protein [Acidobacteriota bacterium]
MWILQSVALEADAEGAVPALTFRLSQGAIKTIGRAAGAEFIVDAALVSRVHCRLTAAEDYVEVVDLSSTNGTYVNDKRVERAQLKHGDRLKVGRVELTLNRTADG